MRQVGPNSPLELFDDCLISIVPGDRDTEIRLLIDGKCGNRGPSCLCTALVTRKVSSVNIRTGLLMLEAHALEDLLEHGALSESETVTADGNTIDPGIEPLGGVTMKSADPGLKLLSVGSVKRGVHAQAVGGAFFRISGDGDSVTTFELVDAGLVTVAGSRFHLGMIRKRRPGGIGLRECGDTKKLLARPLLHDVEMHLGRGWRPFPGSLRYCRRRWQDGEPEGGHLE